MSVVDANDKGMSIRKQCRLLSLNRSGLYYTPKEESAYNETLMRVIDKEFTAHPELGVKTMRARLCDQGYHCGDKRVRRLMRKMGLRAIYPEPKTTIPNKKHEVYPYLLTDLEIERENQVWATDITYIPLGHGFAYLVAIMDIYSRAVLSWRLSNTMDASFCCEVLDEALEKHGKPEIFNSDQGSQFTGKEFISRLKAKRISISMDGKGRAIDNIFVERLWRTVKYQDVYIKGYQTMSEAQQGLDAFFDYYNHDRLHQSLGYQRPWDIYAGNLKLAA